MGTLTPAASQSAPALPAKALSCRFESCLNQARFGAPVIIVATELAGEGWIWGASPPISLGNPWFEATSAGLCNHGRSPPAWQWGWQQMDPGGRRSSEHWNAGSVWWLEG